MEYDSIGRTNLKASKIILGCMSFGSSEWRKWVMDEKQSQGFLSLAHDNGINFFDTANVYSKGISEEILGNFIKNNSLRDKVIISTKMFYPSPELPGLMGLSRKNILQSIDGSLKRLKTDYVDIYQIHRWDEFTPIEETMLALNDVLKTGKVRFIGASNMRCWHLAKAQLVAEKNGLQGFSTMQNHYNLLHREDERDLIPFLKDQGIGMIPWSPLARGRIARALELGEENSKSYGKSDRISEDMAIQNSLYGLPNDPILGSVASVAENHNATPAQIGLAWLISKGAHPILGVTKKNHILDAVSAVNITLSKDEIEFLEKFYTPRALAELPWSTNENKDPRIDLVDQDK